MVLFHFDFYHYYFMEFCHNHIDFCYDDDDDDDDDGFVDINKMYKIEFLVFSFLSQKYIEKEKLASWKNIFRHFCSQHNGETFFQSKTRM